MRHDADSDNKTRQARPHLFLWPFLCEPPQFPKPFCRFTLGQSACSYWYIMFISETINPSHLAIMVAIGKLWNIIGGHTPGYTKHKINIYHLYIRTCSSLKSIAFREHQHDLRSCWRHLHQDLPILPTVLDKVSSTIMHTAYNILCHFFWQEHHVKHTVVFHAT